MRVVERGTIAVHRKLGVAADLEALTPQPRANQRFTDKRAVIERGRVWVGNLTVRQVIPVCLEQFRGRRRRPQHAGQQGDRSEPSCVSRGE